MPAWIAIAISCVVIICAFMFLAWVLASALEEYFKSKWEKDFDEDLALAIKISQPSWPQILQIAASRQVRNERIYWILQRLLREILTGRNTELAAHRDLVESYIQQMKETEPFEGMPKEIRIHLERLREQLTTPAQSMEPLANQIRELLSVNDKEKRQQKYYTTGGFFVGILGLAFAVYPLVSLNSPSPTAATSTQPISSAPPASSTQQNILPAQ
ncbi:hypothetical protein [Pseudomonas sp. Irchel s3h9]|uniref:hypothetical protein n=1 Tax=Pseudomonas sp. Irchel s3h9 TaxID=2009192 RepID=UPI000BA4343D|nr:hypothetical protein [Pseudomonas sp. Irchel s3h9]